MIRKMRNLDLGNFIALVRKRLGGGARTCTWQWANSSPHQSFHFLAHAEAPVATGKMPRHCATDAAQGTLECINLLGKAGGLERLHLGRLRDLNFSDPGDPREVKAGPGRVSRRAPGLRACIVQQVPFCVGSSRFARSSSSAS